MLALIGGILLLSGVCWAQVTTATLSGIVMDNSDAVIPGAEVTLTNENTNASDQATTNDVGEFVFSFIQPGSYTIRIVSPSFKALESIQLALGAAQQVRRRFVLELGEVTESVTVSAEAAMLNTVSAEQREALVRQQFTELPIARRNFSTILPQATGVVVGGSGKYNLNGLGGAAASITVDGTEASADARSSGTSMFSAFNKIDLVSLESIEEVQVVKGVIPAEYGQSLGGNINVISRSGTNEYHGSLFYNYQGAGMGARHPFTSSKPNFVWNQFGGSTGGPILKNRLFFFAAYEGYRETNFSFLRGDVPTQLLRDQMLEALPFPETQPYLDQMPLPNQPHASDAITGRWEGASSSTSDDNHIDLKVDYRVGNAGNLSVSYTRGRPNSFIPRVAPTDWRTFGGEQDRITSTFTYGAPKWTSETRFGFNYNITNRLDGSYNAMDPVQAETIEGQRRLPSIDCQRCPFSGPHGEIRNDDPKPFYSFEEKIAYITGRHSLKFGGIWSYRGSGRFNVENAVVRYADLDDMLANRPNRVRTSFGTPNFVGRDFQLGFFAQDDWRVNSKLVLNLGLRYDYFSNYVAKGEDQSDPFLSSGLFNPDGMDGQFNLGPIRDPNNAIDDDPVNFGPRLGFSYNPDGNGQTTIRGGYSVMFKQVPVAHFLLSVGRSPIFPFRTDWSGGEAEQHGLAFPVYNEDVFTLLQELNQTRIEQVFNPQLDNPYGQNFYLGMQRAIGSNTVLETAFVSTKGIKFTMERAANQIDRITGVRPNPDAGGFTYLDNSQRTFHWSWQTSLRQHFSKGLMFNLHYTYGKTYAHAGGDTATDAEGELDQTVQDFFCVSCEWGYAASDIRHNFAANWLYEVTAFGDADNPVLKHALNGWQISGMITARTGRPLNVGQANALDDQRPDITSLDDAIIGECCGFGNLQRLNRSAFIEVPESDVSGATLRPGNLPNHSLRNAGDWTVDAGIAKNFKLNERLRLQVRADLLNAFNHVNYTGLSTNLNSSAFGRYTNSAPARVIQLNGRITF